MIKKISTCLFFVFAAAIASAQADSTSPNLPMDSILQHFRKVDAEAEFPGGKEAWISFLVKNLHTDIAVKKGAPKGSYTVVVSFVVSKDGTTKDFIPVTHYGFGMEEELIRVIKKSPKWIPARVGKETIDAYRTQPVIFEVN